MTVSSLEEFPQNVYPSLSTNYTTIEKCMYYVLSTKMYNLFKIYCTI